MNGLVWAISVTLLWAAVIAGTAQSAQPSRQLAGQGVKIGLFVPLAGESAPAGLWVRRGAELAVRKANGEGGAQRGGPFRLVVGSADRPWAGGSRELVRLVYGEGVSAVIGAIDGRSGHLAEQIVARAKGQFIFITPWATDTTLTQISISQFFRIVPDDGQQAKVLVKEIFKVRRLQRAAVIARDEYDARMGSAAFVKAAAGYTVIRLRYSGKPEESLSLFNRLQQSGPDAIVLFGQASSIGELLRGLRARGIRQPLFGPLSFGCADFLRAAGTAAEGTVVVTLPNLTTYSGGKFYREFVKTYRCPPHPLAAYTYDATSAVIQAVRKAGEKPEAIRNAFARTKLQGATGIIRFDSKGNRIGEVALAVVRQGHLRSI